MDDGFSYAIPGQISGVRVGSMVRVPLGGRRVRGFVLSVRSDARSGRSLKEISAVSGDLPVFDESHLEALRWAALHYVAPLAVLLRRAAPPNLPRMTAAAPGGDEALPAEVAGSPLPEASAAAAAAKRLRPQYLVQGIVDPATIAALTGDVISNGRSALVVAPTVTEAAEMAAGLQSVFGDRVALATSALSARTVTRTWAEARTTPGRLIVGTREVAFWPIADLAMGVVIEEARRGMKSAQTPTTHVRDVLRRRAAVERFQLVMAGPVPTVESLAAGVDVHEGPGRAWPLVEVVDRTEEPPGSGLVTERVRRALSLAVRSGKRGLVLVHRRGYAPAFRCVRCRTVRRCAVCGAAADRGAVCRRCGSDLGSCSQCGSERFEPLGAGVGRVVDDLARTLGESVGPAGGGDASVVVGTERDLPELPRVDIAAAIDIDGVMLAPNYRAAEDALRLVARLANKVRPHTGNRCIVQTAMADHAVIGALRRGRPLDFLLHELETRTAEGFPPGGELVAIDIRDASDRADAELREVAGEDAVHGPAPSGPGQRWLLQGRELREAKVRLRGLVQRWRDGGARVRVDVDPLDL